MERPNYQLEENPVYTENIPKLLNTDPVIAESGRFYGLISNMLNNTKSLFQKSQAIVAELSNKVNLSQISNHNILHNWDFTNPVNQRGQSIYKTEGYTIDRWFMNGGVMDVELMPNGIRLERTQTTSSIGLRQRIEFPKLYYNKTLTMSIETSNGIFTQTITPPAAGESTPNVMLGSNIWGAHIFVQPNGNVMEFVVFSSFTWPVSIGDFIEIYRVKLEAGNISTLVNDPPADYGTELAKCQRYQLVVQGQQARAILCATNTFYFSIPTPVTMRITPAVANIDSAFEVQTVTMGIEGAQTGFTFSISSARSNNIWIKASKTAHGLTDAVLQCKGGVILDANL